MTNTNKSPAIGTTVPANVVLAVDIARLVKNVNAKRLTRNNNNGGK